VALHSEGKGCGTECIVRLPRSTGEAPPSVPPDAVETPSVSATGCSVVLVDDNQDAVDLLADALRALGHRVEVAYDASAALDLADRFIPDVALLDLGLPVIDGYELASRLRQRTAWADVKFAALTGYGQGRDREMTKAAGFDDHLVKPVDVLEVDAALRHLADIPGARDAS
jgi:CheY-like chemotaxis protein